LNSKDQRPEINSKRSTPRDQHRGINHRRLAHDRGAARVGLQLARSRVLRCMDRSSPRVTTAFHGCRSGTGPDRAPPDACGSSRAVVSSAETGTPARPRQRERRSCPRIVLLGPPERQRCAVRVRPAPPIPVVSPRGSSDPLLGPCRDPFRDRLGGLDVQEVTDVGDDLQRVRGGEPMSVVDLRGEDAAVVGTVELQQGHRDRLR
jgi:hypothetical protein